MALRAGMRLLARVRARPPIPPDLSKTRYADTPFIVLPSKRKNECATARRERRYWELLEPDTTPPSETVHEMYKKMLASLKVGSSFPKTDLFELFHACKTVSDVNVGLHLLDLLHKFRAARLKVFRRFRPDVSELVAKTMCQIGQPYYAFRVLTVFNKFGLVVDLKTLHSLLEFASETMDTKFAFAVMRHMRRNGFRPTADTAHIAIKQCLRQRRAVAQVGLAKEFHLNEVQLHPVTYDMCLVSAANSGRIQDLLEIQKIREQYNIPNSPSSVFSLAKAHLIRKKPEEAAKLIFDECKDEELVQKYVKSMVRLWPVQLAMCHTGSKKSAKHSMNNNKEMLGKMLAALEALGVRVDIDFEQNFGAAKGEGDKYNYCFGHLEHEEEGQEKPPSEEAATEEKQPEKLD